MDVHVYNVQCIHLCTSYMTVHVSVMGDAVA